MSINIIDDFISGVDQTRLEQAILTDESIPWNYRASPNHNLDSANNADFVHRVFTFDISNSFYHINPYMLDVMSPLMVRLGSDYLRQIKINIYPRSDTLMEHAQHVDKLDFQNNNTLPWQGEQEYSLIYYVNNNDGYTKFYPDNEDPVAVESKRGRIVYTDVPTVHNSTTCTNANVRCTINFNFR